jgi:hypothetical protein
VARARFAVLTFSEHLGNRESDLPDPVFPFVGDASTVREFYVHREPIDSFGYLLMQVYHVQNLLHRVRINDVDLRGHGLPPESWRVPDCCLSLSSPRCLVPPDLFAGL